MKSFYIKNEGEKEYEKVVVEGNKKVALLKWAEKHSYDEKDVFYGLDDGQIEVCSEKEWKEKLKEEEREFIKLNVKRMNLLKEILDIKQRKCYYCGKKIDFRKKYAIFNKPTRVICNSILCLTEAMEEDEV